MRIQRLAACLLATFLAACGADATAPEPRPVTGSARVTVHLTGIDFPTTFTVSVDSGPTVTAGATIATLAPILPGPLNTA